MVSPGIEDMANDYLSKHETTARFMSGLYNFDEKTGKKCYQ